MTLKEIREYQIAQLELVKVMDELCAELNLTYYIIGGTLLGAIRHGGFIPWDPDIDIAMPREDYEKVREYFLENESDRYFYQHYSTEKNHLSPHALLKIKDSHVILNSGNAYYKPMYDGIYLDILPLDNAPESTKLQKKQMNKIKRIRKIIRLKGAYTYPSNGAVTIFVKHIIRILLSPVSFYYLNKTLDNTMKKYNSIDASTFVSMASHYSYWKQLMPKTIYGTPQKVNYEGIILSAPAETHEYLTRIYKDYMKLPPEDQRAAVMRMFEKVEYGANPDAKN